MHMVCHLDVLCCKERHLLVFPVGAPDHILSFSRVVHVAGAEAGGVLCSSTAIYAPLSIYADAVVGLQPQTADCCSMGLLTRSLVVQTSFQEQFLR